MKEVFAVLDYLKDKLPEGWKIHHPHSFVPNYDGEMNYILCYTRLKTKNLGVPIVLDMENPNRAAQDALHIIWGTQEMGLDYWEGVDAL